MIIVSGCLVSPIFGVSTDTISSHCRGNMLMLHLCSVCSYPRGNNMRCFHAIIQQLCIIPDMFTYSVSTGRFFFQMSWYQLFPMHHVVDIISQSIIYSSLVLILKVHFNLILSNIFLNIHYLPYTLACVTLSLSPTTKIKKPYDFNFSMVADGRD